MRYYISLLLASASICSFAQNTIKMSAVKSNDYGVQYTLPKTSIVVQATGVKTIRKAGDYYQYAERYLNISNPITKDQTVYSLDNVTARTIGVPDKSKSYLVEFKSNSVAPFVTLKKDGIICAINDDAVISETNDPTQVQITNTPIVNPVSFLSEEILRAGSTAKQAELIAKQIYLLRESRNNIITGEADNMPPDGNAYKVVMDQIDTQEKALTSMFIGTETVEAFSKEFEVTPDDSNISDIVLFRFSTKLGVVDPEDLSGAPVLFSLTNKEPKDAPLLTPKEQKALDDKFSRGIIYNIPAKANLNITYNNKVLVNRECDVVQYGTQEVLVPKVLEYKKEAPVKVIFYPDLGAIKQIIQ